MSNLTYKQLQVYLGCLRKHSLIDKSVKLKSKKVILEQVWNLASRNDQIFAERILRQGVVNLTSSHSIEGELGEIVRLPLNVEKQVIYKKALETGNRRIGLELEFVVPYMEGDEVVKKLRKAGVEMEDFLGYSDSTSNCYKLVYDSSIINNESLSHAGFELVTPPIDLSSPDDMSMLKKALTALKDLGATVRKTCGTHIHIEATDLSKEDIVNYFKVWQSLELELDKAQPKSRRGDVNDYCGSLQGKNFDKCTNLREVCETMSNGSINPYIGRYHKVNPYSFLKYGTLEVRAMAGSLSFDKIVRYAKQQVKILESARV